MSTFDAKVLAWATKAKVNDDSKSTVLDKSLKSIDDYKKFGGLEKGVMKINYGMEGDIQRAKRQVNTEEEQQDQDEIEGVRVGFSFGVDVQEFEATEEEEEHEADFTEPVVKTRPSRRKTVSSEVINLEDIHRYVIPEHPKSPESITWLQSSLEEQYLFEHLEHHELISLINSMQEVNISPPECLFKEGEEGDTFFIVQSGEAEATKKGEFVKKIVPGSCLGEEELMYSAESLITVTPKTPMKCWSLDRQTYRVIVTKASIKKRAMYEGFLSGIDFLSNLTSFERLQVADALKPTEHADGEKIISFGQEGTHFFIIVSGTVKVIGRKDDKEDGEQVDVCTFTVGDCVGELEFINKHHTCADVVAVGPVKTAKMGRRHFEKVMGPVEDFLKDRAKGHDKFEYYRGKQLAQD